MRHKCAIFAESILIPALPPSTELILLPNIELETKAVMQKLASVRAALAEMKGVGQI